WEVRTRLQNSCACFWHRALRIAPAARDQLLPASWMRCLHGLKKANRRRLFWLHAAIRQGTSRDHGRYASIHSWRNTKEPAAQTTRRILCAAQDSERDAIGSGSIACMRGLIRPDAADQTGLCFCRGNPGRTAPVASVSVRQG